MRKRLLTGILPILFISRSFAQTDPSALKKRMTDSLTRVYLTAAAIQYPIIRQGSISTEITGNSDLTGKLDGNDFFKARARTTRIRLNFNIPIAKWGKNTITGTFSYLYQHTDLDQVTNYKPEIPIDKSVINTSTLGFAATYNRADSLFHHPVIYTASVAGFTDELSSVKRVNYLGGLNIPLKRTAFTSYSAGLLFLADPTISAHFIPFINYWHKFKISDIELFVDFPSRALLKKQLSANSWLAFGTELSGNLAFFSSDNHFLPDNFTNSTTGLKTGPSLEYRVAKRVMLGISGGLFSTLSSNSFQQSGSSTTPFMKIKSNPAPYANFTMSFLPFL